jgi:hypothetical protein
MIPMQVISSEWGSLIQQARARRGRATAVPVEVCLEMAARVTPQAWGVAQGSSVTAVPAAMVWLGLPAMRVSLVIQAARVVPVARAEPVVPYRGTAAQVVPAVPVVLA